MPVYNPIMEKRGEISLGNIQTSRAMLNLLEILLEKNRKTIKNECSKKKISLSNYEEVALYIKNKLR